MDFTNLTKSDLPLRVKVKYHNYNTFNLDPGFIIDIEDFKIVGDQVEIQYSMPFIEFNKKVALKLWTPHGKDPHPETCIDFFEYYETIPTNLRIDLNMDVFELLEKKQLKNILDTPIYQGDVYSIYDKNNPNHIPYMEVKTIVDGSQVILRCIKNGKDFYQIYDIFSFSYMLKSDFLNYENLQ